MPTIEPVTAGDLYALLPRLRAADVAEVQRAGSTVEQAMAMALQLDGTMIAKADGPLCVFGRLPNGAVWLLGSDDIERHSIWFLRRSKAFMRDWRAMGRVWTVSDPANDLHRKWLHWLGFRVTGTRETAAGAVFDVMEAV